MCILFLYVSNNKNEHDSKGNAYKLILASNRDEKYSRPSAAAKFWEETTGEKHIFAGQDLEELGTWLGISKRGKLAVLLNLIGKSSSSSSSTQDSNIKPESKSKVTSRGTLVTGFLRSPVDLAGFTYLKNLCQDPENLDISKAYNPFHLFTIDFFGQPNTAATNDKESFGETCVAERENGNHKSTSRIEDRSSRSPICVSYLSNYSSDSSQPKQPEPQNLTPISSEFYALGNSSRESPFMKVTSGQKQFQDIVNEYISSSKDFKANEEQLVQNILQFLRSSDRCFPDDVLENKAKETIIPAALVPYFSSIFVKVPGVNYGTRTHTIILMDNENHVTFHEWTMEQPININEPKWSHIKETFKLSQA